MSKISIKGVLIGSVVDIVSSVVLGFPLAIYEIFKLNASHMQSDRAAASVTAAIHGNVPLYIGQLLVGLACSVLGGYVASWLAKHDELLNGTLSSFLCVALGIYTMASGKDTNAFWLQFLLLIASPAMALLGGVLSKRQRLIRSQIA
jgi:hypothetical protein